MIHVHLLMGDIQQEFVDQCVVLPVYFPASWHRLLKGRSEEFKKQLKLDTLSNKIRMKHPGVIAYDVSENALNGRSPWLYVGNHEEKLEELEILIVDWLLTKKEELKLHLSIEEEQSVLEEKLVYGTAVSMAEKLERSSIIEGLAAYLFCQKQRTFTLEEQVSMGKEVDENGKEKEIKKIIPRKWSVSFFQSFSGNAHEAISEPIELEDNFMSLVVTFTYAMDPATKEKRLVIHPSIRRWEMGKGKKGIKLKGSHSMYVLKKHDRMPTFYKFTVENKKNKKTKQYGQVIKYGERDLFEKVTYHHVTLEDVLQYPKEFMTHEKYVIGIPYGENSFSGSHKIGSGVEQQLKKALYELLLTALPFFVPIKPIPLDTDEGQQYPNTTLLHLGKKAGVRERRMIHFEQVEYKGVSGGMELVVWYEEKRGRNKPSFVQNVSLTAEERALLETENHLPQKVKEVIERSFIGIEEVMDGEYEITTGDGKRTDLTIRFEEKENFDRKLSKGESDQERMEEIKLLLSKKGIKESSVSLVELRDYRNEENQEGDPKQCIRQAFASKGIKTQFIQPLKEVEEAGSGMIDKNNLRVEKALLDVFSKAGFLSRMEEMPFHLYGFSVLTYKNRQKEKVVMPVLARVTKENKEYHFLDEHGWISEERVLERLPLVSRKSAFDWNAVQRKLIHLLSKDIHPKILTFSGDLRHRHIPELRNAELSDRFSLLGRIKGLAICRLNHGKDVPGYYLFDEKKEETTKVKGVVKLNDSVYYSVGQKPDTDKVGKFTSHFTKKGAKFQQRRLAEMAIFAPNEINKEAVAKAIHASRDLTITSDYHTKEEYCLYMINNVKEYLID